MNDNDFYAEYNQNDSKVNGLSVSETSIAFIKSYLWMFLGVFITFISGMFFSVIYKHLILNGSIANMSIFLVLFFASFIVQMVLCYKINKHALAETNFKKALGGFILFSLLNGFSFSALFVSFAFAVLYQIFAVVAGYFLILTFVSFLFRKKIHKMATFAYMGLIALVIASILISLFSFFMYDPTGNVGVSLYLGISIFGLIVFTILTIVDIKSMHSIIETSLDKKSASIAAAFSLYLDFINIFIYILRIVVISGKGRKK